MENNLLREYIDSYTPKMSANEISSNYIKGEYVEHIPFSIRWLDGPLGNILGYTSSEVASNLEVQEEIISKRIEDYGMGGISGNLGLRSFGEACGSRVYYPENGTDYVEEYILDDELDVESLKMPNPSDNKVLTPILENTCKLRKTFPNESVSTSIACPISTASSIRPIEKILRDIRKNRVAVNELLSFCTEGSLIWVKEFGKRFNEMGASISAPVSSMDLLSPIQFEEIVFPHLNNLVNGIYEITGSKPALHMCGHTKEIWDKVAELNISSFSVDNCEDIGECKEALGDKIMIEGNIPPTNIMLLGSTDDVIESVKECIKKAADSPKGYRVSTGCALPLATPLKNIDAYVYAVRTYGANARIGEVPVAVYQD